MLYRTFAARGFEPSSGPRILHGVSLVLRGEGLRYVNPPSDPAQHWDGDRVPERRVALRVRGSRDRRVAIRKPLEPLALDREQPPHGHRLRDDVALPPPLFSGGAGSPGFGFARLCLLVSCAVSKTLK